MQPLRILSMGWGRQTWTMAAMMALGEMPRADYIVHADTTHEHEETYRFRETWEPWLQEHGLKVVTVVSSNGASIVDKYQGVSIPAYTVNKTSGELGQVRRQCTGLWKIQPIKKFVRSILPRTGLRAGAVQMIMGISLDEFQRMRTSGVAYIKNTYPLVDMRWTRSDCIQWLEAQGLPVPPKSSCVFCPYLAKASWKQMKREGGSDWQQAVAIDLALRDKRPAHGKLYLHPTCKPLSEAVSIPEDVGAHQLGLEPDEQPCDSGYCFV